ncbi:MAG: hypothetical protein JWL69_2220 [Phycisphaerales bacterium]|nr:hypothetical protein [Phycisphaerales bacterium]
MPDIDTSNGNRVLDFRPTGQSPKGGGGSVWLLLFFVGYATVNLIAAYATPAVSFFKVMGLFGLAAPGLCILGAVTIQIAGKPRPFHFLALIAFILAIIMAAVLSLLYVGEVGSSI